MRTRIFRALVVGFSLAVLGFLSLLPRRAGAQSSGSSDYGLGYQAGSTAGGAAASNAGTSEIKSQTPPTNTSSGSSGSGC